eukprot:15472576-Alexandrium_andersonii.AAC.1
MCIRDRRIRGHSVCVHAREAASPHGCGDARTQARRRPYVPLLTRPLRAARVRARPCVGATLSTNERGGATIRGHSEGRHVLCARARCMCLR